MMEVHHYYNGEVAIRGCHGMGSHGIVMSEEEYKELSKVIIEDLKRLGII